MSEYSNSVLVWKGRLEGIINDLPNDPAFKAFRKRVELALKSAGRLDKILNAKAKKEKKKESAMERLLAKKRKLEEKLRMVEEKMNS